MIKKKQRDLTIPEAVAMALRERRNLGTDGWHHIHNNDRTVSISSEPNGYQPPLSGKKQWEVRLLLLEDMGEKARISYSRNTSAGENEQQVHDISLYDHTVVDKIMMTFREYGIDIDLRTS